MAHKFHKQVCKRPLTAENIFGIDAKRFGTAWTSLGECVVAAPSENLLRRSAARRYRSVDDTQLERLG